MSYPHVESAPTTPASTPQDIIDAESRCRGFACEPDVESGKT
jgi:hypothetical protein